MIVKLCEWNPLCFRCIIRHVKHKWHFNHMIMLTILAIFTTPQTPLCECPWRNRIHVCVSWWGESLHGFGKHSSNSTLVIYFCKLEVHLINLIINKICLHPYFSPCPPFLKFYNSHFTTKGILIKMPSSKYPFNTPCYIRDS